MSKSPYEPKPGSKIAAAFAALLDGPMTTSALAPVMNCAANAVNAMLMVPLGRGKIVRLKDETGLLHFALAGLSPPENFSPAGKTPADKAPAPKPAVFNPSDPFGLVAKSAANKIAAVNIEQPPYARQAAAKSNQSASKETNATASTPLIKAPPVADESFAAGLFSNGRLTINSGADSITLSSSHTQQLINYIAKIKEVA